MVFIFLLLGVLFGVSGIVGPSMQPTLHNGDITFFRRIAYTPQRGDVIIFNCPARNRALIKRVIGLPGDVVEIRAREGAVYLNGEKLEETYIDGAATRAGELSGPVTVAENTVFVLGDNRSVSNDSRYSSVGLVPYEDIVGKYLCTLFSPSWLTFGGAQARTT